MGYSHLCIEEIFVPTNGLIIHGNPQKNQVKAKKARPTIRTKGEKNNTEGQEKKRMTPKYYL